MPIPLDRPETLNKEFLEIRARILELAAALDRLDRAAGSVDGDRRLEQIRRGLDVLDSSGPGRAERVQMAFSLPYEEDWQQTFDVRKPR